MIRFYTHKKHKKEYKAPKSTKRHKNATKQKHKNANKRIKIKNALKRKHLSGKKVTYSLICEEVSTIEILVSLNQ